MKRSKRLRVGRREEGYKLPRIGAKNSRHVTNIDASRREFDLLTTISSRKAIAVCGQCSHSIFITIRTKCATEFVPPWISVQDLRSPSGVHTAVMMNCDYILNPPRTVSPRTAKRQQKFSVKTAWWCEELRGGLTSLRTRLTINYE
jgi:hypothetical protein